MKRSTVLLLSSAVTAALLSGTVMPASVSPAQLQQLTEEAQRNVIIIMRDQLASVPPVRRAMGARAAAVSRSQSPVISSLQQRRARSVHAFSTINAFATTVSVSEQEELAAEPSVQAVIPDRVIQAPKHTAHESPSSSGHGSSSSDNSSNPLCNTLEPEALQLTNTAFSNTSTPQAQEVRDGNGQLITGKGVVVAYIADGLDPNVPGFIRPDGSHVFIDYQDFTGDPAGTFTAGGEAFGDASSIAAQDDPKGKPLLFDISKFVNPAHPLPSPCNIRIRGMAPGASLVGINVFSSLGYTTTSTFVQGIEYAVSHDDVDVINESFGGNPYPDNSNDPISLANDAAVAAGITVVVATGDAGTAGTMGSPSTEPNVIAVGASTQYRMYAQTSDGAIPLAKNLGYLNNNISAFSSGGFATKSPRTVDVVAPGESSWALCSTNMTMYTDCIDYETVPGATPIESFGGTSESSPLTAGEAALIIQAYRSTHRGNDPTPRLVKRIIMSTATDLGAPIFEQGAGLINSLAAVKAALSVNDEQGRTKPQGDAVIAAPTAARITAEPNVRQEVSFTLTNTGATKQQLTPTLETLSQPTEGATLNINLNPKNDPSFVNATGGTRYYVKQTFKVTGNPDHLDAAIAFRTPIGTTDIPVVLLALLDPQGRQTSYSVPQGSGSGYGHVDVVKPTAGTWTALVWTRAAGTAGSYVGPVQFTWATENYVKLGNVSPSRLNLRPGDSETVTAEFSMPSKPGDTAAAIRFEQSPDASSQTFPAIPVTLRTMIPTGPTGGKFTGTLTGGNSRAGAGPAQTFDFDVPRGVDNMSLILQVPDNGYVLEGELVDPQGMPLSVQPNQDPLDGTSQYALQLFRNNPQPGRWKFVLIQNFTSSGNQTSLEFTARIGFNTARIAASGMPNKANVRLSASADPVTVPIQVTNTGALTQAYFADARLSTLAVSPIPLSPGCSGTVVTLPGVCGLFYLPTEVNTVLFAAQSNVPINLDALNDVGSGIGFTGSPEIFGKKIAADTVVATLSEPEIPYSVWIAFPALIGPYGAAGAQTAPVAMSAYGLMQPFDSAVSTDSGDIWADLTLGTNTFNPLVLAPGQTGTINVTITPDPTQVGQVVTGTIYVDTFNFVVTTGDEVVSIPYTYKVVK